MYRPEWINLLQSPAFLTISDLWIERGERVLCKGLNFNVSVGEIVRVLGDNGAGKSSLLKVIAGVIPSLEGCIYYFGQDITQDHSRLQQDTLYIGHLSGVKNMLTVEENLRWHCPDVTTDKLHSTLSILGLLPLLSTSIKSLSAGQVRRVALSRLWIQRKKLWLLDEPFVSLDAEGVAILENHMKQHVVAGGVVILTTHQALTSIHSRDIDLLS